MGCKGLTSITIPNGVTSIGERAFGWCRGLTSINIPNSVTSIGEDAFCKCSGLTSITIPSGVTKIENGTFQGCSGLTSITLPSALDSIGSIGSEKIDSYDKGAFENCTRLTSINIPNGVRFVGKNTFKDCSGLTSITIPNGVTKIEYGTFSGCTGLTSINIPNSVTSIGSNIFFIPKDIGAFSGCTGLTSITIPNSVTIIGAYTFSGCTGLKSVTVGWQTPLEVGASEFNGVTLNGVKLIVPRGTKAAYRAAYVWKEFNPIIADVYHTITYNQPANGTLKVKSGTQEIASGSTVEDETILTIEATPDQHYKLDSICVNGTRISGLSFTVEDNSKVEAFFSKVKYTVTYTQSAGGTLTVKNGTQTVSSGNSVEYGTELTVKTAPDAGFKLKSLTINGQAIPDNYKFAISEPVTIEVVFMEAGTGLDEASEAAGIVIYPNPVADILHIATDTPIRNIRVFNIYGKEVAHASDTDRINLSHLPAGVYTVIADGKTARMFKK